MRPLTLTPGVESRTDGAPMDALDAQELEAATAFFQSQGLDYADALYQASQHVAARRQAQAARQSQANAAGRERQAQRAAARMPDQRPIPVQEADLEWRQDLADQQAREYRQSGMQWAPDSAGQQAQDMQRAITPSAGTSDPFVPTQFDPKDPIKDDRAVAEDFQRHYGRPPRSQTEVDNHRRGMTFLYRSRNNTRPTSQAPGRWGHRGHSFVSPEEERAYRDHGPGRPSPMMQDMYTGGEPFVLRQQEDGMSGPARAAPAPVPGQPFQVYDPVSGTYHLFKSDEGMDSVMVGGNEVPLGPGTSNEAFGGQETAPVRRLDLERSEADGGPGYVPTLVQGPAGPEWVYVQTQEKRDRVKEETQARQNEQMVDRLAEKAGIPYEDAEKMAAEPGGMNKLRRAARRGYRQNRTAQKEYARDRITTRAAYQDAGVPQAVGLLPEGERSGAIRQLLSSVPGDMTAFQSAQLSQDRADMETRRRQNDQQFEAMMAKMDMEAERHSQEMQQQRDLAEKERQSREGEPARRADAQGSLEDKERAAEEAAEEKARERALEDEQRAADVAAYGTGVLAIMGGNYTTPAARESFKRIAAAADVTYGGFGPESVEFMDNELARLGVSDPQVRQQIINKYGLAGRGRQWVPSSARPRPPVGWPQPQDSPPVGWR